MQVMDSFMKDMWHEETCAIKTGEPEECNCLLVVVEEMRKAIEKL